MTTEQLQLLELQARLIEELTNDRDHYRGIALNADLVIRLGREAESEAVSLQKRLLRHMANEQELQATLDKLKSRHKALLSRRKRTKKPQAA